MLYFLRILLMTFLLSWGSVVQSATDMPIAENLEQTAKLATQKNIPIAILLSFKGLNSTKDLKEEALYPNLLSGLYDDVALFREIQVNNEAQTIDFYGEPLPNALFQQLFNVTSLPVVVFVDSQGNQLTSPLIAGSYEFYGYYLKQKINQALQALKNPLRIE